MNMSLKLISITTLLAGHALTANASSVDLLIDFESPVTDLTLTGGSKITTAGVAPLGASGNFLKVGIGQTASLDLADGIYNQINFIWGTVDAFNKVEFTLSDNSTETVLGSDLGLSTFGTQTYSFSYNSGSLFVNAIKFSNQVFGAFEIDNLEASAVPEPEAYAMILAGLGLIGFAARRKKAA